MSAKRLFFIAFAFLLINAVAVGAIGSPTIGVSLQSSGRISYSPINGSITPLHVNGEKILDQNGNTIQLRGVAWCETYMTERTDVFDPLARAVACKAKGFDSIRIPIAWNPEGVGNEWHTDSYRNFIYSCVDACIANALYVILDFHTDQLGSLWGADSQANALTDPTWVDAWVDWWKSLATKYKDAPNVLYELFNEPNGGTNDIIKDNYRQVAEEAVVGIQSVHPDALILVSDYAIGQIHDAFLTPTYSNIVYVFHRYLHYDGWVSPPNNYPDYYASGDYSTAKSIMKNWYMEVGFWLADSGTAPVILGEFGAVTTDGGWNHWFSDVYDITEEHKISWNVWYWEPLYADSPFELTTDNGVTLTPQGQVVIDYLART